MDDLKLALGFGGLLSNAEIEQVLAEVREQQVPAMSDYLAFGKICRQVGFLAEGILRVYALDKQGEEVTKYFVRPRQFVMDLESFYHQVPAEACIQAVLPSRVLYIPKGPWDKLGERLPKFYILAKSLSESALLNKLKDNDFLNFGTASEKYEAFEARYPDLAQQVPLRHIASYLKITPQSLSRIRKKRQQG